MLILPGLPRQVLDALTSPVDQAIWCDVPVTAEATGLSGTLTTADGQAAFRLRPILGATEIHLDAPEWAPRLQRLRRLLFGRQKPSLVLRVTDMARSLGFYQLLGWEVLTQRAEATTMGTPAGVILLLISPNAEPARYVDMPYREVKALSLVEVGAREARRSVSRVETEHEESWGDYKLTLLDPDGNRLVLLEPKRLSNEEIVTIYLAGGERVAALQSLSEAQLDTAWAEGKWTIRQLAHHLVTVELLSLAQLTAGIAEPEKPFRRHLWQPDDYARSLENATRPIGTDLTLFDLTRRHVAGLLAHLPHAWDHVILRDNAPPTTVRNMVHQLATHTLHHLEQVNEALHQT